MGFSIDTASETPDRGEILTDALISDLETIMKDGIIILI